MYLFKIVSWNGILLLSHHFSGGEDEEVKT